MACGFSATRPPIYACIGIGKFMRDLNRPQCLVGVSVFVRASPSCLCVSMKMMSISWSSVHDWRRALRARHNVEVREAAQASSIVVSALLSLHQRENQENKIQCFILLGKPSSPLEEPAQLINQSIDNFCLSRTGLMTELGRM